MNLMRNIILVALATLTAACTEGTGLTTPTTDPVFFGDWCPVREDFTPGTMYACLHFDDMFAEDGAYDARLGVCVQGACRPLKFGACPAGGREVISDDGFAACEPVTVGGGL